METPYIHTDVPSLPIGERPTLDALKIEWLSDDSPDLSYLEQYSLESEDKDERRYAREDRERLDNYGDTWHMQGCRAKAEVSYSIGGSNRRIETFTSGGLWGIESDSDSEYLRSVERDEMEDLKRHLERFWVDVSRFDGLVKEVIR